MAHALQFYEQYDQSGALREKSLLEVAFVLVERDEFETLAKEVGLHVTALYGDYAYAPFNPDHSPYMIWVLTK